jgi:exodeoxyribonuclease V beta subunit
VSEEHAEFSLSGPLPWQRTTAIEASAGTGKTYALSGLAVRYVAERGVPIDQLLVVTFTNAATAELRERVRSRLVDVVEGLATLAADEQVIASTGADPVLVVLAAQVDRRAEFLDRLRRAVLDFDAATISTIHGFCSQARSTMGVRFAGNADAVPGDAGSDVVASVCNDVLIREALDPASTWLEQGLLSADGFATLVSTLRRLPDSVVATAIDDDVHRRLVTLVGEAATDVDRRMTATGSLSYDTLITSVRDELRDHPDVVAQMQARFQVALIDEFQDTDSAQWEIFSSVFGPDSHRTLVVVGDPKQAIYAFRGGDVHTYLEAVGSDGVDVLRLAENQRSDRAVVEAINALGDGHTLGSDRIVLERVRPTPRLDGRYLSTSGDGVPAPGMQVRFVTAGSVDADKFDAAASKRRVVQDIVDVVLDLLDGGVITEPGEADRPVLPSDIAVLVSATSEAPPIADALRDAGVPSVLLLQESVTNSDAFDQLGTLFAALERPSDRRRASTAALGWWRGWTSERLAAAAASDESDEAAELVEFQHLLVTWAAVLADEGLPALYGRIRAEDDFLERMMATGSGERHLTDLEHLVELVHAERRGGRGLTPAAASAALAALISTDAADEVATDAVQRRVESDATAVRLSTIHKSKGLEFPIVLLPSLSGGGKRVEVERPYTYYEPPGPSGDRGRRVVDVACRDLNQDEISGLADSDQVEPKQRALDEQCGDQHRMTYGGPPRGRPPPRGGGAPPLPGSAAGRRPVSPGSSSPTTRPQLRRPTLRCRQRVPKQPRSASGSPPEGPRSGSPSWRLPRRATPWIRTNRAGTRARSPRWRRGGCSATSTGPSGAGRTRSCPRRRATATGRCRVAPTATPTTRPARTPVPTTKRPCRRLASIPSQEPGSVIRPGPRTRSTGRSGTGRARSKDSAAAGSSARWSTRSSSTSTSEARRSVTTCGD